jgi:hypothetical protein
MKANGMAFLIIHENQIAELESGLRELGSYGWEKRCCGYLELEQMLHCSHEYKYEIMT